MSRSSGVGRAISSCCGSMLPFVHLCTKIQWEILHAFFFSDRSGDDIFMFPVLNHVYLVSPNSYLGFFFFCGSDRAQGDDVSCHSEDFAMVRQKCLSKGLMSFIMTSQARPLLGPFAPRVIHFAPLATALFPYAAWIGITWRSEGEPLRRGQFQQL